MLPNVLPVPAQRSAETQVVAPPSIERVKGSTGASTSSDAERDIQTVPLSSASAPTQRKAGETTKLSESSQPSAGPRLWKREIRQGMELLRTALEGCLPSEQINAASPNYRVAALGVSYSSQLVYERMLTRRSICRCSAHQATEGGTLSNKGRTSPSQRGTADTRRLTGPRVDPSQTSQRTCQKSRKPPRKPRKASRHSGS